MASGSKKYGFDESRFEKAVSRNFICSVCLNVVKDPKMCTNNEHVFCSDCITEHLGHASTCPQCMDPLTVETLKKPPRLFLNFLSELRIKCDHYSRGCRQYVQLEDLPRHAVNCEFAPVLCSNKGCDIEINKRDKIYHETQVCEYRHKCHECTEIMREMDEMKINMDDMKINIAAVRRDVSELTTDIAELKIQMAESRDHLKADLDKIRTDLTEKMAANQAKVAKDMADTRTSLAGIKEELLKELRATTGEISRHLNVTQLSPRVQPAAEEEDIIIAGGWDKITSISRSVERFSWQKRSWSQLPALTDPRSHATSFVYKNQLFVAGGRTKGGGATDSVEMMNLLGKPVQWKIFSAKLPIKLCDHKTVVYQNRLIVVGGCDETHSPRSSDAIYEVLLTPPYSTKLLQRMPEARVHPCVELINDKVYILGGCGRKDSVLMYDVEKNECTQMPSLPHTVLTVSDMTSVSWRDKVILLGGWDENARTYLKKILMYDTATGETEVLPPMKNGRCGSSAVVTGDRIIVMGGDCKYGFLKSVECFNFSSNSWRELPSMSVARLEATAVVQPVNI